MFHLEDMDSKRLLIREFFLMNETMASQIESASSPAEIQGCIDAFRARFPYFFKINRLPAIQDDVSRLMTESSWCFDHINRILYAESAYIGLINLPFDLDPASPSFEKVKSAVINHAMNHAENYLAHLKEVIKTRLDPVIPLSFLDALVDGHSDALKTRLMNIQELKRYYKQTFVKVLSEPLFDGGVEPEEIRAFRGVPNIRPRALGSNPGIVVEILGDEVLIRPDGKVVWQQGPPMSPLLFSEMFAAILLSADLDQGAEGTEVTQE